MGLEFPPLFLFWLHLIRGSSITLSFGLNSDKTMLSCLLDWNRFFLPNAPRFVPGVLD